MRQFLTRLLIVAFSYALATTTASAHAFLEKAIPGVGTTVRLSPSELQLDFTEGVVPAFSGVTISALGGKRIPSEKPVLDRAKQNILHVRLHYALRPGTYVVAWHVVSVDTHRTSGTYKFTVAP
ncbi:MAG: copper homeostasis periplasmic binding protein CopC [Methylovirgula sp.]